MGKLNYTHEDDNIQSVNNQWIITSHYPDYKKFEKLFDELDEIFEDNEWLVGDMYSLADISYIPYLTRFEHLNLTSMIDKRKNLKKWFEKIKNRQNYSDAISNWLNQDYLNLMMEKGSEAQAKVNQILS